MCIVPLSDELLALPDELRLPAPRLVHLPLQHGDLVDLALPAVLRGNLGIKFMLEQLTCRVPADLTGCRTWNRETTDFYAAKLGHTRSS